LSATGYRSVMPVIKPLAGHELLLVLLQFGLLLLVARALGEVAVRFHLPSVVGELLAGFLLGPSLLGAIAPDFFRALFPPTPQQFHLVEVISWLGVIMLLILTGLETDVELIVRKGKGAAAISLGGIVVPFATGLALGWLLPQQFLAAPDKRLVFALFVGTAMSISAIPVIAKVLIEMRIIRRDIGQITLAAGMIDDTIGWILLSVVAGMARSGQVNLAAAGRAIASVLAVLAVSFTIGRRLVSWTIRTLDNQVGGDTVKITGLIVLALAWGSVTHALGLEAVLGAFIVGILVGQVRRFDQRVQHSFQQMALGVFAPVFFALSGLRVDLKALINPLTFAVGVLVLAVAILGKFVGAYMGARATGLGNWEALALGSGMNARGAMEIIVATIGLSLGILTPAMYSIILMVSVVTSIMAPPLLRWTLGHVDYSPDEIQRLEAEERQRASFVDNLKRVLLPTHGGASSQIAAQLVGLMVRNKDVEVTRMFVEVSNDGDRSPDDAQVQERLEQIKQYFDGVRSLTRSNNEIDSAVLAEAERGYDLLVLGATAQRSNGEGPLFKQFVDTIIQGSPCPLLVVSNRAAYDLDRAKPLALRHILLPVGGTEHDRYAAEVAFSIAHDPDTVVDVVHVVSASEHTTRMGADEAIMHAVDLGEDLVAQIANLGHSTGATVHTDVLVADNPANAIVERLRRRGDLVVLSSGRRPISQRAFFGHSIDHVLREAPCPVAVVSIN
jgi:Kef-type K+ transport system membrane component KefB/nucleotide-binding universal stress UspA family protein